MHIISYTGRPELQVLQLFKGIQHTATAYMRAFSICTRISLQCLMLPSELDPRSSVELKHAPEEESRGGSFQSGEIQSQFLQNIAQKGSKRFHDALMLNVFAFFSRNRFVSSKEVVGPWMLGRWSRALKVGLVGMPSLAEKSRTELVQLVFVERN